MIRLFPVEFSVSAAGCITVSLMVLVLPIPWLIAVFLAAAVHESFHLIFLEKVVASINRFIPNANFGDFT